MRVIKQIERMLQECERKRSWGSITLELKDGKPFLFKQTIQTKPEDEEYPQYGDTAVGKK